MKFNELNLSADLLAEIEKAGFVEASPIQEQTIPLALEGKDVIGQAQTGTGKTAAFGLPTLEKIRTEEATIQALVIAPTRELAVQSQEELFRFGRSKGVKVRSVYGGSSIEKQIKALKSGAHIVVGTPGRLLDLIKRKALKLQDIETLILDEADEMLNMGFLEDIEAIISRVPENRQTLLFSATMPDAIKRIGVQFMKEPEHVKIAAKELTTELVDQYYIRVKEQEKFDTMTRLMDVEQPELAIVFGRTKRRVDELTRGLKIRGFRAEGIHGDLDQNKRLRVLRDFKNGNLDVLVATDVAARGLDLPNITHVFNYDLPRQVEDYVHRIGRSGRAGRTGIAINLCSRDDRRQFGNIARYLKRDINEAQVEGLEPRFVEKFEGRGKPNGRDGRGRGRSGSDSRGGRDDRGSRSQRFGGSSERPSSERRFADKPRFDNQERYGKPASNDSSARFEKRERFDKGHQGNSDSRFGRDDASAPRRHRDSDNRHGNSQGDFHRAAKSSDKPNFDRDSRQGNREPRQGEYADRRRDDNRSFNKDGFKGYQGDKPRYNTDRNSSERHGERPNRFEKNDRFGDKPFAKKTERSSEFRGDDRARKPRPIVEETFGQPLKKRSDRPYPAKDGQRAGDSRSNGFKSEGFRKSDKPFAGKSSRSEGFKSSSDRYASSSKPSAKPAGKQDGWDAPKRSRRNSTGKPL